MARLRQSLLAKLIAAQLLVIVAGSATLALVALAVAPGLFRSHVREAIGTVPQPVADHLDRAFADAVLLALGIAVGAALVTAVAASGLLAVRMLRPVSAMARAAQRISRGHYETRVPAAGRDELARLAEAFNEMASALEGAERRRRELVSDVAHEFRTPLATLEGYVEGMADGTLPRAAETWRVLSDEIRRLTRLVDDLATVSRAEERQLDLRLRRVPVSELADRALRAAAPAYAAKGVELLRAPERGQAEVEADTDRIAEVLANLLENALRHTPAGGRVEVGWSRDGDEVEVSVADTGEGIAAAHLPRVFERFYRADRARSRSSGGSGIGLTIARAIVQAHGGRIRAESPGAGRGARIVVTLPLAGRGAVLAARARARPPM